MLLRVLGLVPLVLQVTTSTTATASALATTKATIAHAGSAAALYDRADQGKALWVGNGRPTEFAREALSAIATAASHGLDEADYPMNRLVALHESIAQGSQEYVTEFESELGEAFTRFIVEMRSGIPRSSSRMQRERGRAVLDAVYAGGPQALYELVVPRHQQYAALQQALRHYRDETRHNDTAVIEAGPTLKLGVVGPRVGQLRNRLLANGEFAYQHAESSEFDAVLEQAVIDYQTLHGLDPDGAVGPQTWRHLNMSVAEKIARLKVTLAKWRELPADLGRDYVQVNIPEYRMQLVRGREETLSMRVVVGSRSNPTPELNNAIEHVVFNPFWHVPKSIAVDELLPEIRKNPAYLQRNGYDIVADGQLVAHETVDWNAVSSDSLPFRFRQRPGANNALGAVKFLFPNPQNIYLHDSPSTHLYARSTRAFSHGCIRLEYPEQLAVALLEIQEEWTKERIESTISGGKRRQVNLAEPVPVYLTYHAVKVTDTGEVAFFNDIYGRDARRVARLL